MLDLSHLNEQQQQAVKQVEKPLLLLAGAGSGKTRVITYKIAHIIASDLYKPSQILALTFTKKAANEMSDRVKQLLTGININPSGLYVGTFHAFGAYLLRKYAQYANLDKNFSIYDMDDQLSLVKNIIKDGVVETTAKPRAILQRIADSKLKGISPDAYFRNSYGDYFDEIVSKVYKAYAKRLVSLNAVDFTDLLRKVVDLFDENPHILEQIRTQYKYLMVDEYQDTNMLQYEIVQRIASQNRGICVVGDEDQSIYSWRGATIENIKKFMRDFPEHEIIKLEQNYRSTPVILEAANKVIVKNPNRIDKKLWTSLSRGELIKVVTMPSAEDEVMYVVRELNKFKDNLNDVAILYRVNAMSRIFEEVFVRFGVPYRLVGGVGFYQRLEIKDLLAYLKFINNHKDEVSLLRIINTPSRKIGAKTIEKFRESAKQVKLRLSDFIWYLSIATYDSLQAQTILSKEYIQELNEVLQDKFIAKYEGFFKKLGEIILSSFEVGVNELIHKILHTLQYQDWILKMSNGKEEQESRLANIKELQIVASRKIYKGRQGLHSFLEDIALMESAVAKGDKQNNAVNLMTVHSAKGLEFKTVFIVGAEEGMFPHQRSFDNPVQMQEERRLFYVAITRAKEYLYITNAQFRNGMPTMPSNYLADIPERLMEWEQL